MLGVRARIARVATRLAAAFVFATAAEARAQDELDLLARRIPAESDPVEEVKTLLALAEASGLVEVRVDSWMPPVSSEVFRVLVGLGASIQGHKLTAHGAPGDAVAWLERLPLSPRPVVIESYEIAEAPPNGVRLVAQLVFPVLDPYAISLESVRGLLELCDRPASSRSLAVFATFAGRLESLPASIERVRFLHPDWVGFDAVAVGARTVAALEGAWGAGDVDKAAFNRGARGDCRLLSGKGWLPGAAPAGAPETIAAALSGDLFVSPSAEACSPPPATLIVHAARRGSESAPAGVSLRTRGASRSETLRLLGRATGRPAIGWGGEDASVDLDFESVPAEEALAALTAAGAPLYRYAETLVWGGPPLDRAPGLPYVGEPVTIDFTCADLDDLLAIFSDVSGLALDPGAPLDDCAGVYAEVRPWDEVLDALLAATRIEHAIEGASVRLEPLAPRPVALSAPAGVRWRAPPERLAFEDLRLVGVVRTAAGWRALARAPLGLAVEIGPGEAVAGGRVLAVDEGGATVALEGREVRLSLPGPGAPSR